MYRSSTSASLDARYATVGDRRIHYVESGSGPVVLLLHGGGPGASGLSNYSRNLEALASRFRVVVPDMPGYGRSTKGCALPGRRLPQAGDPPDRGGAWPADCQQARFDGSLLYL